MTNITKNQLSLIAHSLGGTDSTKWFRNHFVASPSHTDLPDLIELKKLGLMKEMKAPSFCDHDSMLFLVTEDGKRALMNAVAKGTFKNGMDEN